MQNKNLKPTAAPKSSPAVSAAAIEVRNADGRLLTTKARAKLAKTKLKAAKRAFKLTKKAVRKAAKLAKKAHKALRTAIEKTNKKKPAKTEKKKPAPKSKRTTRKKPAGPRMAPTALGQISPPLSSSSAPIVPGAI